MSSDSHSDQEDTSASYIITKGDINAVTELVRAALGGGQHIDDGHSKDSPVSHIPRAPTFTDKGLVVAAGTIVESTVSSAEVQLCLSDGLEPQNFLHVVSETTVTSPVLPSKKSMHEVIWEGNSSSSPSEIMSPLKAVGTFDDDADDFIAPEHDFPTPTTLKTPDIGHYFDPNSLSPERNTWPFRSPRDETDFLFPSSETEAPSIPPLARPSRPALKSHVATMKVPQIEKPAST